MPPVTGYLGRDVCWQRQRFGPDIDSQGIDDHFVFCDTQVFRGQPAMGKPVGGNCSEGDETLLQQLKSALWGEHISLAQQTVQGEVGPGRYEVPALIKRPWRVIARCRGNIVTQPAGGSLKSLEALRIGEQPIVGGTDSDGTLGLYLHRLEHDPIIEKPGFDEAIT